jgi:hypothetical protein
MESVMKILNRLVWTKNKLAQKDLKKTTTFTVCIFVMQGFDLVLLFFFPAIPITQGTDETLFIDKQKNANIENVEQLMRMMRWTRYHNPLE